MPVGRKEETRRVEKITSREEKKYIWKKSKRLNQKYVFVLNFPLCAGLCFFVAFIFVRQNILFLKVIFIGVECRYVICQIPNTYIIFLFIGWFEWLFFEYYYTKARVGRGNTGYSVAHITILLKEYDQNEGNRIVKTIFFI